jgi:hypothetical protein
MTISGIYQGTSFTKSGLLRLAVNLDGSVYGKAPPVGSGRPSGSSWAAGIG